MKSATNLQEELMTLVFQVGRQLKKQLGQTEAHAMHEKASPYQVQALFSLLHSATTMSELAEEMSITLPSTTALVDRLVKNGWVERQADDKDRRIIRLLLTQEGRDLCAAMKQKRKQAFQMLVDALPEEDVVTLHRIFTNLHQRLDQTKTKGE